MRCHLISSRSHGPNKVEADQNHVMMTSRLSHRWLSKGKSLLVLTLLHIIQSWSGQKTFMSTTRTSYNSVYGWWRYIRTEELSENFNSPGHATPNRTPQLAPEIYRPLPSPHSRHPPKHHSTKQHKIRNRHRDLHLRELNPWLLTLASHCFHRSTNSAITHVPTHHQKVKRASPDVSSVTNIEK